MCVVEVHQFVRIFQTCPTKDTKMTILRRNKRPKNFIVYDLLNSMGVIGDLAAVGYKEEVEIPAANAGGSALRLGAAHAAHCKMPPSP